VSTPSAGSVLVIDDEAPIRRFLRAALTSQGYVVHESATAADGIAQAAMRLPDVVLLDLGLPDQDGLEVTRRLREWSAVPILVLSARGQEADKIKALDAGADDYLSKPFGVGELLARVRATLRRQHQPLAGDDGLIRFGDVTLDLQARLVTKAQQQVHLTPTEYRLLSVLVANAGRVVTNPQLLKEVWGPSHSESGHYLRIYMGHLRQKLEDDPAQPKHLLTETAVGYRILLSQ
jgi:two-component system KDP operon response regulator KdpE